MVLKKEDFDKILHFISRIQVDCLDFRFSILSLLRDVFGHQHLTFFLSDEQGLFYNPIVINMDDTLMRDYEKYYFKTDIFHPVNSPERLINSDILSIKDIMSYAEFKNTEYYNDLLKKYNLYYELALPLKANTRLLGGIGVLRPKEDKEFTPKEKYILGTLNKHIASSLNIHLNTLQLRYEKQVIQDSAQGLPVGVIILDDKFSLLFSNETAQHYCCDLAENYTLNGSLSNMVKALLSRLPLQPWPNSAHLQTTMGQYSFKITPLIAPSLLNGITTYYSIYVTKSQAPPFLSLDNISALDDLTEREKEIVKLIMENLNNNEIAKRLYISPNTVKTHVLNIFKKTKVKGRMELIKKIYNYHPPL